MMNLSNQIDEKQVLVKNLQDAIDDLGTAFQAVKDFDEQTNLRKELTKAKVISATYNIFDDFAGLIMQELEHRVLGKDAPALPLVDHTAKRHERIKEKLEFYAERAQRGSRHE